MNIIWAEPYQIEDGITAVWGIKDIVDTLAWRYLDHPRHMTEDEMHNHLHAISVLIDMHCEKLMDTYCKVYQLNEYASDEIKAKRAELLNSLANPPKPKAKSKPKAKKK
jgi:hypothetical protein